MVTLEIASRALEVAICQLRISSFVMELLIAQQSLGESFSWFSPVNPFWDKVTNCLGQCH